MLQRVSFVVERKDVLGILHLVDGESAGSALVLHGFGGHPDQPHIVAACEALAAAGIAALRFAYRDHQPPRMTLDSALADARGAVRLLEAHPACRADSLGAVGFSFGGAVAALLAGGERAIRSVVLAAAPASFRGDRRKPFREVARSRARVLLLWGSRDAVVPFADAERYAAVLRERGTAHRIVTIDGGDHDFEPAGARHLMASTVAEWVRESF